MFDGWFTFAGNEIVNTPRFNAYVEESLPHLSVHTECSSDCSCDHLHSFLGDKPYGTPWIDDAPWVDHDRTESYGFLGVRTIGITGLTDDSRTADVLDALGDGGWVTGRRRAPKEVRFSVLLAATSEESMEYGEQWLKAALDGECEDGCTPTAQLCYLTDCVDPAGFTGVQRTVDYKLYDWRINKSQWQGNQLVMNAIESWAKLRVAESCGEVEWTLQMIGEKGSGFILEHDGLADVHEFDGTLQTFLVNTTGAEVTIRPIDSTGLAAWREPLPDDPQNQSLFDRHLNRLPMEGHTAQMAWRQTTTVPLNIQIVKVFSRAHYEVSDAECSDGYYRFLRRVACIEGPRPRRTVNPAGGGVLRYVDFVLVAEVPYIFGMPVLAASGPSTNLVEQVTPFKVVRLSGNIDECSRVDPGPLFDPLSTVSPPPPGNLAPVNPLRESTLRAAERRPYGLVIPAETIPQWANVVPIVTINTTQDVRYVRVRFMPMPFDSINPVDLDPCSACGSFEIAYIPSGATFVIDGTAETATALIGGQPHSASHLLTSITGDGNPSWPTLSCGVGYLCVIDTRDQALEDVKIELVMKG